MKILGIETSCDETAAAVVKDGRVLLSNVIASSVNLHTVYGGVVPEIAARSHIASILPVINQAITDAFQEPSLEKTWDQIDAIAVTQGPGLLGSLLIGVLTARTLAIAKNKPLYAINHVQAHIYAAFLTEKANSSQLTAISLNNKQPEFPILALIVSGGHTQLVLMKSHINYKVLGQTKDDAVGEAFDKVAKMLGLPYPGGPSIAKIAKKGNPHAFKFPKAKFDDVRGLTYHKLQGDYRFSFSGLKTAVLRLAQEQSGHDYTFPSSKLPKALNMSQKADIAASFQYAAVEALIDKLEAAAKEFKPKSIVVAGGVAANQELRAQISSNFRGTSSEIYYPDIKLCTDNAAMVAAAAFYHQNPADPYTLEVDPNLQM